MAFVRSCYLLKMSLLIIASKPVIGLELAIRLVAGGMRSLGIPTAIDRLIQQAVVQHRTIIAFLFADLRAWPWAGEDFVRAGVSGMPMRTLFQKHGLDQTLRGAAPASPARQIKLRGLVVPPPGGEPTTPPTAPPRTPKPRASRCRAPLSRRSLSCRNSPWPLEPTLCAPTYLY